MNKWTCLLLIEALLFTGCGQITLPDPTPADAESVASQSQDTDRKIVAEAVVEPVRWAAEFRLETARSIGYARLRAAQAGVTVASAQQDASAAQLELLRTGVRPEDVAVSEVMVQQAEAALETAKAVLAHTEVRAPFAGTVTTINAEVGEAVAPGDAIVMLAALDQLQVLTTDLTELDVARLRQGQSVMVKVDALPDISLPGRVARIDLQSVDHHGDVTYPVTVELQEAASELRWGMTAMVEIEAD